eukprot:478061_1
MNANNKYTVGRKIDGKKINTDHDYLAGDESESVDMDKRIAVTKRNGRIEFTGNTFDHKEMLKDMFKARWDADAKVWWVFDHKTLHKIKTELRDHGLYDNRMTLHLIEMNGLKETETMCHPVAVNRVMMKRM